MTPHQRGRLGGLARSAIYDGREMTAKARQAARDRFLEQVDPTGDLRRKGKLYVRCLPVGRDSRPEEERVRDRERLTTRWPDATPAVCDT
jgi:hypothetical protein